MSNFSQFSSSPDLFDKYLNEVVRDINKYIRQTLNIEKDCTVDNLKAISPETISEIFNFLLSFFKLVSTRQFDFFKELSENQIYEYLRDVVNNGIFLYIPVNNQINKTEVIKEIDEKLKPIYNSAIYTDSSNSKQR